MTTPILYWPSPSKPPIHLHAVGRPWLATDGTWVLKVEELGHTVPVERCRWAETKERTQ